MNNMERKKYMTPAAEILLFSGSGILTEGESPSKGRRKKGEKKKDGNGSSGHNCVVLEGWCEEAEPKDEGYYGYGSDGEEYDRFSPDGEYDCGCEEYAGYDGEYEDDEEYDEDDDDDRDEFERFLSSLLGEDDDDDDDDEYDEDDDDGALF